MTGIIKILPLIILFLFQDNTPKSDYSLMKHINNKGNFITVDELGSLFLVNGEQLKKFDINGRLLCTYSNLFNGNISFVDAGDPFKILVYYRDFSQIVFLDNFLSESAEAILLETLGLELSTLACSSYNSGFWVYMPQNFELLRVGQDMVISHRSGDISSIIKNELNPNFLIEKDNVVYLNDPDIGIIMFDMYGTYNKIIPLKNLENLQLEGNNIISSSDTDMRIYNLKTSKETLSSLPEDDPICVNLKYSFHPKRLFLLSESGINIYAVDLDQ